MNFISSEKGKKIIIEDKFKFRFHKMSRNDLQRWKYFLNTYNCFFKTIIHLRHNREVYGHNHEKCDSKFLNRQKCR